MKVESIVIGLQTGAEMAGQVLCAFENPRAVIADVRESVHVVCCWSMTSGGFGVGGRWWDLTPTFCSDPSVDWPIGMISHSAYSKSALQVVVRPRSYSMVSRAGITMLPNVISIN